MTAHTAENTKPCPPTKRIGAKVISEISTGAIKIYAMA